VRADPLAALDSAARETLAKVLELLAAERASVSSVVDERAWRVHVADSLTGLEVPELREAARIADVGAGAGFPGLALAVALPDSEVDLIESVGRKCDFMRRAINATGIANARVLDLRSEEWGAGEGRELYGAVTARAVGRLSTLAELASPLLKEGGVLVAWKGKRDAEEEAQLDRAAGSLAMRPEAILDVGDRGGSQHRHLHVIRKSGPTPADLPRRPGMAKKRPKG
jgi:16S rRNA (guanine527-N7)-methyltransferase